MGHRVFGTTSEMSVTAGFAGDAVVLYELVVKHRWHRLLHVQLAARLRRALQQLSDVVITSVPYHLPS
jgi:hypothetical protein